MAKRRTGTPTGKANISSIIGGKTITAGRTGGKKTGGKRSVAQPGIHKGKTIQGGKSGGSKGGSKKGSK